MHGGEILVSSELGRGSTFTVQMRSTRTWHFSDIDQRQKFAEAMLQKGFEVKTDIEWEVSASEAEEQALAEIEALANALNPRRAA